ncbi:MAG: amidohydrolase family protein [Verrucomicrobiota bacterium]|nr:amidohydrolase family protein [Verrucomicrobiota bacterium]
MSKYLFTHVNVLDCSGEAPFKGEVLVENQKITEIVREGASMQHHDAEIIHGGDNTTLMPGLVESHAHLSIDNVDDLSALGRIPIEEHTLLTMHNAKLYLDHGITSCISAASAKPRLDVVIRNAIEKGDIPGPRLLAATPWLTVTGGLGDMRKLHMPEVKSMALVADGPEAYRRLTRELIREGVDIIKLLISGDSFVPHAGSETTVMSEEEVAAAAAVAHAHGKRLSAHARSAESVKRCIRNGINMIYHANYADEEALDMLEENRDWLFVSPNIGFTAIAAYEGSDWFTEEQVKEMGFREELQSAISGIRELMKRGVRILGGGDYGFMITPHGQNARDLDHFMQHGGMTPMEAMLTMTKNGGEAMGLTDSVGQVKEGFLADLLLVKGDPLANPKVLLDTDNLAVIMKDGQVHKRSI